MHAIRVRLLERHHRHLHAIFQRGLPNESVAFLTMAEVCAGDETFYLVQDVIELAPDDYLIQRPDIASISPDLLGRLAQRARAEGIALAMAHVHPMEFGGVDFSQADDVGNFRTFRYLSMRAPATQHLSFVFNATTNLCQARAYKSGEDWLQVGSVRIVDAEHLKDLLPEALVSPPPMFGRQAALIGREGQAVLAKRRIVTVGGGGIGSLNSAILTHSGARNQAMVEHDHLEDTNIPRVVGATPEMAEAKKSKAEIAQAYAQAVAPDCIFDIVHSFVESPDQLATLIAADLIVVATDNATSKAYLNQLCYQYLVPILDMGVEFVADPDTEEIVNDIGKVNLVVPGSPCLVCSQDISPAVLLAESLPLKERQLRAAEGYVRGLNEPQPSMMPFNTEVVARGTQRAIAFLVGMGGVISDISEAVSFFGVNRKRGWYLQKKRHVDGCPVCGAAGVLALGNAEKMWIQGPALS